MLVSVVIPTYKRIRSLERLLSSLIFSERYFSEIIIVTRSSDRESAELIVAWNGKFKNLLNVSVSERGVVAAMNVGVLQAKGDWCVLLDDDVIVPEDWFLRFLRHIEDDSVVAVGGRDRINGVDRQEKSLVGKVTFWGKVIGNHHLGKGVARPVDVLKGCNFAFRKSLAPNPPFDVNLKGNGAQVHWEMVLCAHLQKHGRLIYDPGMVVGHFIAERHDEDQRGVVNLDAEYNRVFNEMYALSCFFSKERMILVRIFYEIIGSRANRGLFQWVRFFLFRKGGTSLWLVHRKARSEFFSKHRFDGGFENH